MNQANDPEQTESSKASEQSADSNSEPPANAPPAQPEPPRGRSWVAVVALLVALVALAWPWLEPHWQQQFGDEASADTVSSQTLQSALQERDRTLEQNRQAQQALSERLAEQLGQIRELRQSLDSEGNRMQQALSDTRRSLADDIDTQSQRALERIERLARQLERMEENWLSLQAEVEELKQRETPRQHGWQLQEAERLLRRASADWSLQADARQALLSLQQVEGLLEEVSATGLGALRERLSQRQQQLQRWIDDHPDPAESWQSLHQQLRELGWQRSRDDAELDQDEPEEQNWRSRLSRGFGRLVRVEREQALEPELWDLQARESLQLLMQQELILAESAHRRGQSERAIAHAARLEHMLQRFFDNSDESLQRFAQQLSELVDQPAADDPQFDDLADRSRRIREAMERES